MFKLRREVRSNIGLFCASSCIVKKVMKYTQVEGGSGSGFSRRMPGAKLTYRVL